MRVAALDLGSNTTLLLIAEVRGTKIECVLHDETWITRLGQGVQRHGRFHHEALARMDECLGEYAKTIRRYDCDRVIAVTTSAARDASNRGDLLAIGLKYHIPITVIAGEREAQLTFRGAIGDCDNPDGLAVIDVGGGSTEFIFGGRDGGLKALSVDVGSVRLSELFVHHDPISLEEKNSLESHIRDAFELVPAALGKLREVIAVAGTPTTLSALEQKIAFSEELINGHRMSLNAIDRWIETLANLSLEARAALPGMPSKRADVIVAGALILGAGLQALGVQEMTVCTRGVRYGTAMAWKEFEK